ncbi:MAG: hypothetical protein LBN33_05690, partial [Desulfovibrio sp.]|nr:hypothetical protein [Desulfovibrio sp.]
NQAQRCVRAAILEIIPGDIIEDAVGECEKTMDAKIGNVAEAAAKLVDAFSAFGVTREAIEKRLGHRIDAIQPAQVLNFRKIYTSIKDGMNEARDWFELEAAAPAQQTKDTPKPPAEQTAPKGNTKPNKPAAPAPRTRNLNRRRLRLQSRNPPRKPEASCLNRGMNRKTPASSSSAPTTESRWVNSIAFVNPATPAARLLNKEDVQ